VAVNFGIESAVLGASGRMKLSVALLTYCVLLLPSTSFNQLNPTTPLWSKEYLSDPTGSRNPGSPKLLDPNRAGVTFLDDSRLLAYEVDFERGQFSSRKNPDSGSAFRLHLSMVDVLTGTLVVTKDWATRPHESSIQIARDRVLLRTGPLLRVLSEDLEELTQLPLAHADPYEGWEVRTSPGGETVLLNRYVRNRARGLNLSEFKVLDGRTLGMTKSWTESPAISGESYTISNATIALDDHQRNPREISAFSFVERVWKPLWVLPDTACAGRFTFVTNERIAYACKALWLVSSDGKVLLREPFQNGESLGFASKFAVSGAGESFAISVENVHDTWDSGLRTKAIHVAVYNSQNSKRVLTLDVKPLPKVDFDFALSPDGSKLAILNDRNVTVFLIPLEA
jgi:hypothetical protein